MDHQWRSTGQSLTSERSMKPPLLSPSGATRMLPVVFRLVFKTRAGKETTLFRKCAHEDGFPQGQERRASPRFLAFSPMSFRKNLHCEGKAENKPPSSPKKGALKTRAISGWNCPSTPGCTASKTRLNLMQCNPVSVPEEHGSAAFHSIHLECPVGVQSGLVAT